MARITKGYKTGKAQPVWKCAREIRICTPNELGKIHTCSDWDNSGVEQWMCIKINNNYNDNIMQKVWK